MTKRTRLFLLAGVGILVLGLGTGVVASYMGLQTTITVGGQDASELAYVPPDAKVLAFANVREVMDSELRHRLLAELPGRDADNPNDLDDLYEATGIDIERDVDQVVASVSGPDGGSPVVVTRGRFDAGRIEWFVRKETNADVETYKGTRLVKFREHEHAGGMAVAFAEPGVIVLGSETGVKRSLDSKLTGSNVTSNAEIMKLVRDSHGGNAWAVVRFDELTSRARLPQEIANHLPAINWFAASGHVNGGLRARLRAETRDDASAQNLREVIRGVMALARLQTGQRPELDDLLNSVELGGTGKTVSLGFAIDPAIIDALGALKGLHPLPPAPPEPPQPPALPELPTL